MKSLKALVVDLNAKKFILLLFYGEISIYKFSFVVVFMLLIPEREREVKERKERPKKKEKTT